MRHIVKKRVTGLSFTTGLVIRISHDEEEAPRSLKPSINSVSPSLAHFRVQKKKIYVKDLCQIVTERNALCSGRFLIKKHKYFKPQTAFTSCVRLSDDAFFPFYIRQ